MGLSRLLVLTYPQAILLGALAAYLYWRFVPVKNLFRTAAVLTGALLLTLPVIRRSTEAIDIILVADRSRSVPAEARQRQTETFALVERNLGPGDQLGLVSFNERPFIEQHPSPGPVGREFDIPHSEDASDVAAAIRLALSLARPGAQTRILLLSDGQYTGTDPAIEAHSARQQGIPIHVRDLGRSEAFNVYVAGIDLPSRVVAGEPFRVTFRVRATAPTAARYRILRSGRVLGGGDGGWRPAELRAGDNVIRYTDVVDVGGIHGYQIEVEALPEGREPVTIDNIGQRFLSAVADKPVLVVNDTGAPDSAVQALRAAGMEVHLVAIANYRLDINRLTAYSAVVLNNVAVTGLTLNEIGALTRFVTEESGGLVVAGGNRSFGRGGYYRTALETVLPVSLEDRMSARKVSVAISYVLDRSGSMAVPVPSGGTKMDLANHGVAESISLLTAADSVSVIPVDSAAHIFLPQQPVTDLDNILRTVRSIKSMGGGIFTYTGLVAAGRELIKADQMNKHIALFADAADAEEPGEYINLLREYREAGITVSVIALGTETDVDAEFLKDVAERGGGRIFFTQTPEQLVQFFTADTMAVTRNSYVTEPAPIRVRAAANAIAPEQRWQPFTAAGYNLVFPVPGAEIALQTADDDEAPILAFWQKGLGRAVALALDAGGPFADNPQFPNVVTSAVRWAAGSQAEDSFLVKTSAEGSTGRVTVELDDEQVAQGGAVTARFFTPDGHTFERPMQWDRANRLSASVPLDQTGAYRGVIIAGNTVLRMPPLSIPVSPEFTYQNDPSFGRNSLLQIASITGGREVIDVRTLFERTRRTTGQVSLLFPLLILFLALLFADMIEQRFAVLPVFGRWVRRITPQRVHGLANTAAARLRRLRPRAAAAGPSGRRAQAEEVHEPPPAPEPLPQMRADAPNPSASPAPGAGLGYLAKSKDQARKAMRKSPPS